MFKNFYHKFYLRNWVLVFLCSLFISTNQSNANQFNSDQNFMLKNDNFNDKNDNLEFKNDENRDLFLKNFINLNEFQHSLPMFKNNEKINENFDKKNDDQLSQETNLENSSVLYFDDKQNNNVLTKRIALSSFANIFGGSSDEELKEVKNNITESKLISLMNQKPNVTDEKNLTDFSYIKNHQQNDKEYETLNRLINFSKNYNENWSEHPLKNFQNVNHHQDLFNLLKLNNSNMLSDFINSNITNNNDLKPKKNFEDTVKSMNGQNFGFKPNDFLTSFLNNRHNNFYNNFGSAETISEASDQNSEYEDNQFNNSNQTVKEKENNITSLPMNLFNDKQILENLKNQNIFDNQDFFKNLEKKNDAKKIKSKNRFKPIRLIQQKNQLKNLESNLKIEKPNQELGLKNENSSAKRNLSIRKVYKNKNSNTDLLVENSLQSIKDNKIKKQKDSTDQDNANNRQSNNQRYSIKQSYHYPTNFYGKRLINDVLNNQQNMRNNLIATKNSFDPENEILKPNLDLEENVDTSKEELLNEQDKQLVTDKNKDTFDKIDEEISEVNDFDKIIDKTNEQLNLKNSKTKLKTKLNLNEKYLQKKNFKNNQKFDFLEHQIEQPDQLDQQIDLQIDNQNNENLPDQKIDSKSNHLVDTDQIDNQTDQNNLINEQEKNDSDSSENDSTTNSTNNNDNDYSDQPTHTTQPTTKKLSNSDVNEINRLVNYEKSSISKLMKNDVENDSEEKYSKPEKNLYKPKKSIKKTVWKSYPDNYKHHKIYEKLKNSIPDKQNFEMDSYLSNENFKINLSNQKSELDDDLSTSFHPFTNSYFGKPNAFTSPYYPFIKKKPNSYYNNYPNPGFSTNQLNSMLFDKFNSPFDYALNKLATGNSKIPNSLKGTNPLDNKINSLHQLNNKFQMNGLSNGLSNNIPPAQAYATNPMVHHLEPKFYDNKNHYDLKYHHSMGNWQSGLAGFLLGVVPFSMLMASMVPTISAISSGGAAAAALGRKRRSIQKDKSNVNNGIDENAECLIKLAEIIESINKMNETSKELIKEDEKYFKQLIELQKQCEFNFTLPIDIYKEIQNLFNFEQFKTRNGKNLKRIIDSYYYNIGNKSSLLDMILNFFFNYDGYKEKSFNSLNYYSLNNTDSNDLQKNLLNQPLNIFHFKEGKCLQEAVCKILTSPTLEKTMFSNVLYLIASLAPNNLINKYGLNVLIGGLKEKKCSIISYC